MLSVTNTPFMLNVIMLSVIMASIVAPPWARLGFESTLGPNTKLQDETKLILNLASMTKKNYFTSICNNVFFTLFSFLEKTAKRRAAFVQRPML